MSPIARVVLAVAIVVALTSTVGIGRVAAVVELDHAHHRIDELFCIQPHVGSACYNGGAQTVTAGASGELAAVELYLARQDFTTTTRDLVVEIRAGGPNGALLATSRPVPAATIPTSPVGAWTFITFPTPPTITAGDVFAIVIPMDPLSPTFDPAWGWGKSLTDTYAGGVTWGGSPPSDWQAYVDGSDLAFRSHVSTDAEACDLALAWPGRTLANDHLNIQAGVELQALLFDFGPNADVTVEFAQENGDVRIETDTTDAFGDAFFEVVFSDLGDWEVVAYPTANAACTDEVLMTVFTDAIVPPNPLPPPSAPAASTAPHPAPTPAGGQVPNTSAAATEPITSWLGLGGVALLGAALAGWAVTRRPLAR